MMRLKRDFETSKRAKTVGNTIFIFAGTTENELDITPPEITTVLSSLNNTEEDQSNTEAPFEQPRFRVKKRKFKDDGPTIYEAELEDLATKMGLPDMMEDTLIAVDYVWDIYTPAIQQVTSRSKAGILLFDDEPLLGNSESEDYDIADQDSNAEDWYANDYPDEEDSPKEVEWEISTDEERAYRDEDEENDGEYYGMESYSDE
ncbi:hypothetical protein NEOLI_004110 [Neolecta irregularis DAH-3]|uniref:Transcription factor Iwr1 domain-containing protein n=1 Tax=Neolecta irregularis (strain DAH-3) TaxID=1198029 RepID=A0A1U7LTT7_NEOID|nr:hypothetical protein NEOLI_004110 [Neolecta irregularis DAH-3]|eukprot:OLL26028.1 hypothetical protein NEOLI_004110 [Neolecta irregularis DAH-3]